MEAMGSPIRAAVDRRLLENAADVEQRLKTFVEEKIASAGNDWINQMRQEMVTLVSQVVESYLIRESR